MKTAISTVTQNNKVRYIAAYTAIFAVIFVIGFIWYMLGYVYFLRKGDTLTQHYPALIYIGDYLRALPRSLMNGELPMYDFTIGMGDDIFATLLTHSANADIFNLLFAFVPRQGTYAMYIAVVILRLYFAGLAFSYFCYTAIPSLRKRRKIVLLGSLIYVFSGWVYVYCFWHPSFMIALLYLPLIVAGFDKVLRKEKPYIFIISVFLFGLASFYYLYMVTILLIGYALIRIHHLYGSENYLKNVLKYGVKSAVFFVVGIMMSAVLFIPLATAHLTSGREAHITTDSLLCYPLSEYIEMILSNISPLPVPYSNASRNTRLGLSVIVPIMLIIMLFQKPRKKHMIIAVVLAFLVQNIPFGALVLNGFAYLTNRIEFLFNFVYVVAAVVTMRDFRKISGKAAIALAAYTGVLIAALMILRNNNDNDNERFYIQVGIALTVILILILLIPADNPNIRFVNEKRRNAMLGALAALNLAVNVCSYNSYQNEMYVLTSAGDMFEDYVSVSDYAEDDSFYRQSTPFSFHAWDFNMYDYVNEAMLSGYYGVSEYWSMANPAYMEYSAELENMHHTLHKWRIDGFDNRTILNEIASVKYTFVTYGGAPYGYEEIGEMPFRTLYKNNYALPLGYTYEKSIPQSEYKELHPLDKQEALMQAVALPQGYANYDVSELGFGKKQIPYDAQFIGGIIWASGIIESKLAVDGSDERSEARDETKETDEINMGCISMELQNDGICNGGCEIYVRVVGFDGIDPKSYGSKIYFASTGVEYTSSVMFPFSNDLLYTGRDTYLINLGYFEEPVKYVALGFEEGQYKLEDIEVYCVPMDNYAQRAEALAEAVLENIDIGINSVRGDITLDKEKILFLSIPYSRGWSAKVNGENVELLKANTGFMAIPLEAGHYDIELTYATPGIKLGAILSLTGVIIFIAIVIAYRKTRENL